MKWTCGCLAIVAALSITAVIAGWYALSGWTRGGSAWENLPPDTVFAFEAHDVGGLLKTAGADSGALSLANAFLGGFRQAMAESGIPVNRDLPRFMHELNSSVGWLFPVIFPNYILFGARSFDDAGAFLVIQPPKWFAWMAGMATEEGKVEEVSDNEGRRAFFAFRDGFAAIGMNADIVQHVVDNWGAQSAPMGSAAGRDQPYCMFAARRAGNAEPDAGGGAPFLSGGLADNFAKPPPGAAEAPETKPVAFQALFFAGEGGWNISFELASSASPAATTFTERVDAAVGADISEVVLPDASDLELALRLTPDALKLIDQALEAAVPPRFGGDWLRHGWLDRAGGTFALLASRPAARAETADGTAYPPLPVTSLGWNLGSLHAPTPFGNFLERWLDGLGAPGGPLSPEIARSLVTWETEEDRLSGTVSVPPVFANGARPAWGFLPGATPPMGWMATDPSGLPAESLVPRLAALNLPAPGPGRAAAAANWDMSRAFIDAAADVLEDRLSQLPDEWFERLPAGKRSAERYVRLARRLFAFYPRGAARADVGVDGKAAAGKAFIPFGMSVGAE